MSYGARILFLSLSSVMFMGVVICPFFEAQTRGIYPLSQRIKPLPKVLKSLLSSGVVFCCCCCCFLRGGGGVVWGFCCCWLFVVVVMV